MNIPSHVQHTCVDLCSTRKGLNHEKSADGTLGGLSELLHLGCRAN